MTENTLAWFNNEYEKVLHSGLSDSQKSKEYANLMTEMEYKFKVPMLKDPEWEKENRSVIALYRKISNSRDL
ncbi:hypothetical protein [Oceanobacillus sp. CF4.6]|uniref:hypothetical protein n=1 Tax=Oceanobacillus sp. CF4.6 TaxID=3373080 RepID=UPI003EE48300